MLLPFTVVGIFSYTFVSVRQCLQADTRSHSKQVLLLWTFFSGISRFNRTSCSIVGWCLLVCLVLLTVAIGTHLLRLLCVIVWKMESEVNSKHYVSFLHVLQISHVQSEFMQHRRPFHQSPTLLMRALPTLSSGVPSQSAAATSNRQNGSHAGSSQSSRTAVSTGDAQGAASTGDELEYESPFVADKVLSSLADEHIVNGVSKSRDDDFERPVSNGACEPPVANGILKSAHESHSSATACVPQMNGHSHSSNGIIVERSASSNSITSGDDDDDDLSHQSTSTNNSYRQASLRSTSTSSSSSSTLSRHASRSRLSVVSPDSLCLSRELIKNGTVFRPPPSCANLQKGPSADLHRNGYEMFENCVFSAEKEQTRSNNVSRKRHRLDQRLCIRGLCDVAEYFDSGPYPEHFATSSDDEKQDNTHESLMFLDSPEERARVGLLLLACLYILSIICSFKCADTNVDHPSFHFILLKPLDEGS